MNSTSLKDVERLISKFHITFTSHIMLGLPVITFRVEKQMGEGTKTLPIRTVCGYVRYLELKGICRKARMAQW